MPDTADTPPPEDDFDRICRQLGGFDDRITVEWADGFLAGVLAGPRAVPVEEWLPALCGDAFDRAFGDPESQAEARAALLGRWRDLAAMLDAEWLLERPDELRLEPRMLLWDEEARAAVVAAGDMDAERAEDLLLTGAEWAEGVLDAVQAFEADWRLPEGEAAAAEAFAAALEDVRALTLDRAALAEHLARAQPGRTPTRDELIDEACFALQDLRSLWVDFAPRPPTRRVEPTPGRNDPCPCGSGRKYKRCHGA